MRACYYALFTAVFDALQVLALSAENRRAAAWRAVLVFTLLQVFMLSSVELWWQMLGGEYVPVPRGMAAGLSLGLLGLNYLAFLRHERWEAYLASTSSQPPRRKQQTRWLARLAVVLLAIACGYTYVRFGRWATPHWQK